MYVCSIHFKVLVMMLDRKLVSVTGTFVAHYTTRTTGSGDWSWDTRHVQLKGFSGLDVTIEIFDKNDNLIEKRHVSGDHPKLVKKIAHECWHEWIKERIKGTIV